MERGSVLALCLIIFTLGVVLGLIFGVSVILV